MVRRGAPRDHVRALGPGRVNLIGEHTDYNDGLCLPFAVDRGVTVEAEALPGERMEARALDLGEEDEFPLHEPERAPGWRAFVRGVVAEMVAAGLPVRPARLTISGDVPLGGGLSSSAALEVGSTLALLGLSGAEGVDRRELARLCSRVENEWVGAQTGLLDQLASLFGEEGAAVLMDMRTLAIEHVPLELGEWTLATVDSGAVHEHAGGGYNDRRDECRRAAELLGVASLRDASPDDPDRLPEPLGRRVRHVVEENGRVDEAVAALRWRDLERVGDLLDASHASLRDLYDASVPAVEATVARLKAGGASGARMMGGGFGGHVLALFGPGAELPEDAVVVRPGPGARLLDPG